MTMVDAGPGPGGGAWGEGSAPPAPAPQERRPADNTLTLVREAAGTMLIILAMCLIGFAVWFASASRLYYDRIQTEAYANFRVSLGLATAPTGPTDPANPTQLLASGTPVAVLSIPEIDLTTVVFQGTSGEVLEGGPGHLRYTPMPGQPGTSVIFGRRTAYGGPFSRLSHLQVGDQFTVTTAQGKATYRVIDRRRAGDPTPPLLAAGQGRLILATADGLPLAPTGVLYVDADLTSTPRAAPTMILSESNMAASELILGTDSNAWVPVVLWGALLLGVGGLLAWARQRWGRWQVWIVAVPVVCFISLSIADQVARLLPNIM
jgi:sortase A